MHGLLSFGKIRTGSCKIVYIASYRSRARFERRRPIYSIVSDHCRANPNFSELSIPRISSTPLLLLSATPIILLLSLLTLYLRDSPVSLFSLNFFLFSFPFFFSVFQNTFLRVDFYQKYISHVYMYIRSLQARRHSSARPSSKTYEYANYQGSLDRSDMESSSRRCSPQFLVNFFFFLLRLRIHASSIEQRISPSLKSKNLKEIFLDPHDPSSVTISSFY